MWYEVEEKENDYDDLKRENEVWKWVEVVEELDVFEIGIFGFGNNGWNDGGWSVYGGK